jgi:glycerol-3-phosphate acyltransferase PlsY
MEPTVYNFNDGAAVGAGLAVLGGFMFFFFLFVLAIYIFMAICLMKIAKKTNTGNAWFAWIPILNLILMIQCSKKSLWWIILFLIPFVNIIASIIIWMNIAKNLGKPEWLGILTILPLLNIVIPAYLAFSDSDTASIAPTSPSAG